MSLRADNMSVLNSREKKVQPFIFCIYTQYNNMNLHSSHLTFPLGDTGSAHCFNTWVVTLPQIQIHLLYRQFKNKYASREY